MKYIINIVRVKYILQIDLKEEYFLENQVQWNYKPGRFSLNNSNNYQMVMEKLGYILSSKPQYLAHWGVPSFWLLKKVRRIYKIA